MAIFATSIVSQIKGHHQSQNLHISLNQQSKCIKNACILEYDYGKVLRKLDTHIPILEAWGLENDSGSFWDQYFPLNRPLRQFSVFTFFTKIAKFLFSFGRNFQGFCALGFDQYMYGKGLGLKFGSKTLCIDVWNI